MNCRQAEQGLLLKDTGELPDRDWRPLEEHLAGCASCRAYRDELGRVMVLARRSLPTGAPAAQTMAAIRAAARAGVPMRTTVTLSWTMWRTALAAAAIFLLCLGGWHWLAGRVPRSGGSAVALAPSAAASVAPLAADNEEFLTLLMEDVVPVEQLSDLARPQEISALDSDLLLLEGLAI